jgi:uncharacterized membrane protein
MYDYGPGGFHHSMGVFAWVLMALVIAVVVLGVVALIRLWNHPGGRLTQYQHGPAPTPSIDPAFAELRLRYARGDITWDEYSLRARNLGYPVPPGDDPTPPPGPPPVSS